MKKRQVILLAFFNVKIKEGLVWQKKQLETLMSMVKKY